MNVMKLNGIKVYNLTATRAFPEWASRAEKRRKMSKDPGLAKHLELIQDLEMPDSSTYICTSPDGQYLFALGRYKPRVKCYELSNLSLKFDRCVDYLPYRIEVLSEDYSKFALLEEERWVDVHAAGGHFFKFRIPKPGVDIAYSSFTCDLFVASSRNSIYRMNLYEGRFNTPLFSSQLEGTGHGFSASAYRKEHSLLAACSTAGRVDGWDARTGDCVLGIKVSDYAPPPEEFRESFVEGRRRTVGLSCITYKDPLNIAVGTTDGMVYLYDLRQNRVPWHVRDTEFRRPVKTIDFHEDKVITLLPHCLKIWYLDTGKIFVGFDTGRFECNWLHHFRNSGLLMLATESPKIATYFLPLLGEAPSWCGHLDQLVLECEPDVTTMYDGYKFVTREELAELGMLELIGTQFLRAYMHGYFVSMRLYTKIKERLGLVASSNFVPTKTSNQTATAIKTHSDAEDEFTEASRDTRFAKLKLDPKFTFDPNNEDSDLIRIHQARLAKKRRRKEQRKERAARAHNGETDANAQNIIQGTLPILPPPSGHLDTDLSTNGIRQARALRDYLKTLPVDLLISSDLKRAYMTVSELGLPILPEKNALLRERNFGVYCGSPRTELHKFTEQNRTSGAGCAGWHAIGAECSHQVSHGGWIRQALRLLALQSEGSCNFSSNYFGSTMTNCGICQLGVTFDATALRDLSANTRKASLTADNAVSERNSRCPFHRPSQQRLPLRQSGTKENAPRNMNTEPDPAKTLCSQMEVIFMDDDDEYTGQR
ncbi:unnamed protein product [Dicrocoelium dendriticum]|nr:unnamed protein product [Dicrocoelium dendriticum]